MTRTETAFHLQYADEAVSISHIADDFKEPSLPGKRKGFVSVSPLTMSFLHYFQGWR